MPAPWPQEQVEFLQKVQRLLTEGLFVASYKFALLRALAGLAVLKGDDSGDELELGVRDIAGVFVDLYWRQTRPFCAAGVPQGRVLRQNTGRQAAVIQCIGATQAEYGSLGRLRQDAGRWVDLVAKVADTVAKMPLWKLQRACLGVNSTRLTAIFRCQRVELTPRFPPRCFSPESACSLPVTQAD